MGAPKGNKNHTKHGLGKTRLYHIWKTMRQRCFNPKNCKYYAYGKRGITICKEWNDFINFYSWAMENGYSEHLSIDRIDVNGNYEPKNCRWSSSIEQANNMRTNKIIHFNGENYTMANFCRAYNLNYKLFAQRLKRGKSVEEAMKPVRRKNG